MEGKGLKLCPAALEHPAHFGYNGRTRHLWSLVQRRVIVDELIDLVMEKTGLGKGQAKQAVDTVMGFLKKKLPDPIASQLDNVLENDAVMDQASDLLDKGIAGLGGLLNKK